MPAYLQLQIWRNIATGALSAARQGATRGREKLMPDNPGVQKRLKAFQQDEKGLPTVAEEDVDDLELDMMNAHQSLDDHEREISIQNHIRTMKIVERKYFKKPKEPSMVFWEEKEQMRFLHNNDPEEWSVSRLAASFPVSEAGAQKILKANWSPQDTRRVQRYNESVRKKWMLLQEGKLDVCEKLRMHLMKFVPRTQAKLPSSDSHLAVTPSVCKAKGLHDENRKTAEVERLKLEKNKNKNTQQAVQKKAEKNKQKALHGTHRVGDTHYDDDDGEFLFRVPGMNR